MRYLQLYYSTGTVKPTRQSHGPARLLNDFEQLSLIQSLLRNPTMYLEELQSELVELTGTMVHKSTICRTIQHLGLTRKKITQVALQHSEDLMFEFMAEISSFHPNMIVWLDENGSSRRNSIRSYGYSFKGLPAISHVLRVSGKRVNAIGIMSTNGLEDVYITEQNVNGYIFQHFLTTSLLPILKPFDGINDNSVVYITWRMLWN